MLKVKRTRAVMTGGGHGGRTRSNGINSRRTSKKESGPETDVRFRRRFPLGRVSYALPSESSILIARIAKTARKLHLLRFLSDVDYQRGRSVLLIEGFLDDLLHRATVLDPNFCVRNTSEKKK